MAEVGGIAQAAPRSEPFAGTLVDWVLLVEQVPGHSQLRTVEAGLDLLRSVRGPIAPVVVIGPYRSGKSFLLNQMLGVSCGQGFGVGHTRDTQTKGVWLWSELKEEPDESGANRTMLFVDTEGFESTARSSSYDDRIFAVAAVLSSLLIYNLPETIRESDVSKLSFAVDLASGFYDQWAGASGAPLQPGRMLWVIQRDFLQGKGVQQLVSEALAPVPNPESDHELEQLNKIRASLTAIAGNSTGFSLPQPHLDRTRLCDIADSELNPRYVSQREALQVLVRRLARRKVVGSQVFNGGQLADLLSDLVKALNEKEIPTGASLLESFNQQLVARALAAYTRRLEGLQLPLSEEGMQQEDAAARADALRELQQQLLGRKQGAALKQQLSAAMDRERKSKLLENGAASNDVCQRLEMACTRQLDALGRMSVPSMRQFEGSFGRCKAQFEAKCIGPARAASAERLDMAWARARRQFGTDYNGRLLMGLLALSVAGILVFRFVLRARLLEFASWLALGFLELYPKVYQQSMYETAWWRATSQVWETAVLAFVGDWAPLTWAACGGLLLYSWRRRRRLRRKSSKGDMPADWWLGSGGGGGSGGGSTLLGDWSWPWLGGGGSASRKRRNADGVLRDLDV